MLVFKQLSSSCHRTNSHLMSDKGRHSQRSLHASSSGPSHSRLLQSTLQPSGFLNMLNPMRGRAYQGYLRADQSVLEEDEDENGEARTGERGGPHFMGGNNRRTSAGWGEASQMSVLRRHDEGNTIGGPEFSDDEVPQSFMIEPVQTRKSPRFMKKPPSPTNWRTCFRHTVPSLHGIALGAILLTILRCTA